jgi:3-dehydroquinate synthase
MKYRQELSVPFKYDVIFTHGVFEPGNDALAEVLDGSPAKAAFFVDDGLAAHWPNLPADIEKWCGLHKKNILSACPVQLVGGGEKAKEDISILDRVGRLAADCGLCRHSYIIIVGGGAVLDAVGFAASTIHRGLRQIRVPTTVLSQADSGVGVKNGLNRFGQKNYFGAFAPPKAVVCDTLFLETLSVRDWTGGLSEAFKVAIIKDREFFEYLDKNAGRLKDRELEIMEHVVKKTALLHLDHIRSGGDPFEEGSFRPLDFGHWAAHRLESMTAHALGHGEAVAIGLALDLHAAVELGFLKFTDNERILGAMERCGLALWHPALEKRNAAGLLEVIAGLEQFREHLGGELSLAMPNGLGAKTEIRSLAPGTVERAVKFLKERAGCV